MIGSLKRRCVSSILETKCLMLLFVYNLILSCSKLYNKMCRIDSIYNSKYHLSSAIDAVILKAINHVCSNTFAELVLPLRHAWATYLP